MNTAKDFLLSILSLIILTFCVSCEHEKIEPESTLAIDILNNGKGLRVGAAVVNINPKNVIGASLEGYEPRVSTGINDTLTSRCIIIADNSTIVALISLDLIGITEYKANAMKSQIRQFTGILEENIFIHATHTHSGPSIMDGRLDKAYLSSVYENTRDAVVQALNSLENVKAIVRSGTSSAKTVNRRNPKREVINDFTIIEFQNDIHKNVASILNFSCHPVVLGPRSMKISADYVHYLRKSVEEKIGGIAIFFNGSFGNINPARFFEGNPYDRGDGTFNMARDFGETLANDMLFNYTKYDTASIAIRCITNQISRNIIQKTSISILDLGIIQIAMLPGEPFESFGADLEDIMPGPYKFVIGLTNDYIGYITPEDEWGNCTNSFISGCYEETLGGGPDVANILIEGFRKIIDELN